MDYLNLFDQFTDERAFRILFSILAFINGTSVNIHKYISLCTFIILFLLYIFPRSGLTSIVISNFDNLTWLPS